MKHAHGGLLAASLLSALVALPLTSAAQGWGRGGRGSCGGDRLDRAVESLDLDADKRTKVFAVIDGARAKQRDLDAKVRKAHETLHATLDQPTPDSKAVMAQADALGALELEAHKAKLSTLLQVRALLTPEEQQRLRDELEPPRHPGGPPPRRPAAGR